MTVSVPHSMLKPININIVMICTANKTANASHVPVEETAGPPEHSSVVNKSEYYPVLYKQDIFRAFRYNNFCY